MQWELRPIGACCLNVRYPHWFMLWPCFGLWSLCRKTLGGGSGLLVVWLRRCCIAQQWPEKLFAGTGRASPWSWRLSLSLSFWGGRGGWAHGTWRKINNSSHSVWRDRKSFLGKKKYQKKKKMVRALVLVLSHWVQPDLASLASWQITSPHTHPTPTTHTSHLHSSHSI